MHELSTRQTLNKEMVEDGGNWAPQMSDAQRMTLNRIENGFIDETNDDGSNRWSRFFTAEKTDLNGDPQTFTTEMRDAGNAIWSVYVDRTRQDSSEGWQVWRSIAGTDEYGWVGVSAVIHTRISANSETLQLCLGDDTRGERLMVRFSNEKMAAVQISGQATEMQPMPRSLSRAMGDQATKQVVERSESGIAA